MPNFDFSGSWRVDFDDQCVKRTLLLYKFYYFRIDFSGKNMPNAQMNNGFNLFIYISNVIVTGFSSRLPRRLL